MAEVKPAEVSAILKQQLAGFEASASLMVLHVFTDYLMFNTEN